MILLQSQCANGGDDDGGVAGDNDNVASKLTITLVHVEIDTYRMRAAEILKNLCINYTEDYTYLKKLKTSTNLLVPQVTTICSSILNDIMSSALN